MDNQCNKGGVQDTIYNLYDEVTLRTDDGDVKGVIIREEDEDGLIVVQTEKPINGKIVNLFSKDCLDGMNTKFESSDFRKAINQVAETDELPKKKNIILEKGCCVGYCVLILAALCFWIVTMNRKCSEDRQKEFIKEYERYIKDSIKNTPEYKDSVRI